MPSENGKPEMAPLQREREIARLREWQIVFKAALIGASTVLTMLETEDVNRNG